MKPQTTIAPPSKRGLSRVEAARYMGISPTTLDRMIAAGDMPAPVRFCTRKIWDRAALDRVFDTLGGAAVHGDDDPLENNDWD